MTSESMAIQSNKGPTMTIQEVTPEWLIYQLNAGHDVKHISDYLRCPQNEIRELMRIFKLIDEKPLKIRRKPRRIIPFEEVQLHDIAMRNGAMYTVIKKDSKTITVKAHTKASGNKKITKKKWKDERWKINRDEELPVCYNLQDASESERLMKRISIQEKPNEVFAKSFERAMRGLVKNG